MGGCTVFCCSLMFQNCSAERDLSCLRGWITLGINNDYNVILCLMNEFEFGTTQPSPLLQGAEKGPSQYHLSKMFKISLKYHSRLFLNCLKYPCPYQIGCPQAAPHDHCLQPGHLQSATLPAPPLRIPPLKARENRGRATLVLVYPPLCRKNSVSFPRLHEKKVPQGGYAKGEAVRGKSDRSRKGLENKKDNAMP